MTGKWAYSGGMSIAGPEVYTFSYVHVSLGTGWIWRGASAPGLVRNKQKSPVGETDWRQRRQINFKIVGIFTVNFIFNKSLNYFHYLLTKISLISSSNRWMSLLFTWPKKILILYKWLFAISQQVLYLVALGVASAINEWCKVYWIDAVDIAHEPGIHIFNVGIFYNTDLLSQGGKMH